MTVNQVRRAAADAVMIYAIDHRLFDLRMVCQSQVVVAAETDDLFIIDDHLDLLWAIAYTTRAVTMLLLFCVERVFEC